MRDLHALLLETEVGEGKMVCGNCGHEYRIKEGIANFLLPNHLGGLRGLERCGDGFADSWSSVRGFLRAGVGL
jgi:hypothetical protein